MPQCTAVCRHVSHRVIYSPFTLEMPWMQWGVKTQQTHEQAAITAQSAI